MSTGVNPLGLHFIFLCRFFHMIIYSIGHIPFVKANGNKKTLPVSVEATQYCTESGSKIAMKI